MTTQPTPDFFDREKAAAYDRHISRLAPIVENLHFLIRLVLCDLPTDARVLCVGVGTGAEILSLAAANPGWTFVGVDPSQAMLEVCRERLTQAGILDRCALVHGYLQEVAEDQAFDAALSVLVVHFISIPARRELLKGMAGRLRQNGYLVTAEISCDLDADEFPLMFANWAQVQKLMGATPESLADLPRQLREVLTVLPHDETERMLRDCGIPQPVRFFQAFMIAGWYGRVGRVTA